MLKILQIYYEPRPSGQTTHVLSLIRGLDRQKYRLMLALPTHLQPCASAFSEAGIEVISLPLRKVVWGPSTIISLIRLIRNQQIDIVHVHSQEAGLPMRLVARLAGRSKVVYTPQTIDIRRTNWQWLYLLTERVLAQMTEAIISVNEFDRKRLVKLGISPEKIVTIPNGIDLDTFRKPVDVRRARETIGLSPGRPLVIQVGRLSPQKDPLAFVAGAAIVAHEYPEVQFALVGEGPLRDVVATSISELGLQKRVHLLGWQDEAFRLIAAADLVTLTSHWEGIPYALLEAMAWARPVVATSVNGCPEVVIHKVTGLLVP
ncbi:MAG: glycosyltransferase, partial [Chloroflexi bacterium]|nr:glycosyltransferase [Chloroflexota bacterium]